MTKSKVDRPSGLKYLGFGFYFDSRAHQFKAKPHEKSVAKFKRRMKELTCRSWGVSNSYKVEKLNQLIRGWINYFKIGSMKVLCATLDQNIRFRLRMCIWKHWKTPQNRAKNLIKLVAHNNIAANVQLTKSERRELAHVLYNACMIDGVKVNIMSAIDIMVESLKRIILDESKETFKLPVVIPIESMEGITE